MSLVELFDRLVRKCPNKVAILYHGKPYRVLDLFNLSNKIANWLELSGLVADKLDLNNNDPNQDKGNEGVTCPKQVGLMLGNIPELASFLIGVARVRASSVVLNPNQRGETLLNAINTTSCDVLVFEAKYLPILQEVASQLPDKQYFMYDRNLVDFIGHDPANSSIDVDAKIESFRGMSPTELLEPEVGENFAHFIDRCPATAIKKKYNINDTVWKFSHKESTKFEFDSNRFCICSHREQLAAK